MAQLQFIYRFTMVSNATCVATQDKSFSLDTAHVLPVLFAFTTPAKFCYRAIASFTKHVTGMSPMSRSSSGQIVSPSGTSSSRAFSSSLLSRALSAPELLHRFRSKSSSSSNASDPVHSPSSPKSLSPPYPRPDMPSRAKSLQVLKSTSDRVLFKSTSPPQSSDEVHVEDAGNTLNMSDSVHKTERFAGECVVYCDDEVCFHNL